MLWSSGRGTMDTSDVLREWIKGEVIRGSDSSLAGPFAVTKAVAVYEIEDVDGARYLGSMWENFCEWDSGLLKTALHEIEGCDADD